MDSHRRQRSIALNHIPPLPIPHGLEYPLGSRMHLCVVHSWLKARGRPFPRSPRSRSRVNPRVLRPLTRAPQGQPSPLRTPWLSRSSGHYPDFPWSGSPWLAHGSPLHGDSFPDPTGLLLSILRLPSSPGSQPRDVPFPCATSRHPTRPVPRVPRLPILLGLLCGPSLTPFSVPSPSPFIPCLYPSGPPATLWRGPTGSSSIRGPFRAPSTGSSLPAPVPFP